MCEVNEYRCEVPASTLGFVHELEFWWPTPPSSPHSRLHQHIYSSIRHPIPTQEPGNALVTTLRSRAFMGGGDHL
ncbi:hypothetical protein EVAR_7499_1 [Eumeta japonica]|uniref:Uncharacterized protein n=1 Tax=Eumeta variegata TaxID=151549 RepID=A0A4C1Y5W6_EUMVA|nr:hypothetical protein EVAR_7499_1 [Eumeta japonica]